ncbi:MAG: transporter, partial [Gammaproteobacteria bacterium]
MKCNKKYIFLFLFPHICLADPIQEDSCSSLFSLINRPSVADSPCAVKPGKVMVEMGFQYQSLYPGNGNGHKSNFPTAQLRFGLPAGNELSVLMPNYITQHYSHEETLTGSTATVIGIKHQFPISQKWTYAAEALVTPPSGNNNFGSNALGTTLNGIVNYNLTSTLSATMMLGVATQTASFNDGGQRYNSFNPDLLVSWQLKNNLQVFAEVYGQTKTGPDQHDGYNADTGIQYLLTENIE